MEDGRDALVEQKRQRRDDNALHKVERHDREHNEGRNARYPCVDRRAHADDCVKGHTVKRGKLRDEVYAVEKAAENGEHERADLHADKRGFLAGLGVVDDAGGQDERAADDKVGKFADERGRRALQKELDHDLDKLRHHARDRTEVERADEHRHLAYVELIEARREEERQLKEHEHASHAGENGGIGDVMRAGEGLAVAAEALFGEHSHSEDRREHGDADEDELQVFHKIQLLTRAQGKSARR